MKKLVLHVGSGGNHILGQRGFDAESWQEQRLDSNPAVGPDIVCSMVQMAPVADASVDAIYCAHSLEHLAWHDAQSALREFHRVLKPNGFAIVLCPDMQAVADLVVKDKLTDTAYKTGAGQPITPMDMIWGWRLMLAQGADYMAHRCGYTLAVLMDCCRNAGFSSVRGERRNLTCSVLARVDSVDDETMAALVARHLG